MTSVNREIILIVPVRFVLTVFQYTDRFNLKVKAAPFVHAGESIHFYQFSLSNVIYGEVYIYILYKCAI